MEEASKFKALISHLRPHKTVPITPWRAKHRWDLSFSRLLILIVGLALFGFGDALVVQSNLGNPPWTVLAQGISRQAGISLIWGFLYS